MLNSNQNSLLRQGLITASVAATTSLLGALAVQAFPAFPPVEGVKDTTVRVAGSTSTTSLSEGLKQGFQKKYPGSKVNVATLGSKDAIAEVAAGKMDLAVIGRPLSDAEKAQGLVAVPMGREKIAIVVDKSSPMAKDLTIANFAKLFRGEVSNWSAVGGPKAPVKLVDRTESDTRKAFPNYPAFQNGKFVPAANALKVTGESAKDMAAQLGKTGISYLPISALDNMPNLRVLTMHGVKPTDARYPFSHPLYYVYKGDQPNEAVKAFLGFAGAAEGQNAIKSAGLVAVTDFNKGAEKAQVAAKPAETKKAEAKTAEAKSAEAKTAEAKTAEAKSAEAKLAETKPVEGGEKVNALKAGEKAKVGAEANGADGKVASASANQIAAQGEGGLPAWLAWILLPLGLLGLLLWLLPNDEEENGRKIPATKGGDRRPVGAGAVDRAKDTVGGVATKTTGALGDVANTGLGVVTGTAAAATGAGAAAWARLKGERDGGDSWDETDGANSGVTPEFNVETPDWNPADMASDAATSVKDGAANVVDGGKNAVGGMFDLGAGAIAGGAAAAAGAGAMAWNAVKGTGDEARDAGTWEFKESEPSDNPVARMSNFVADRASGAGDTARTAFGNTKDAVGGGLDNAGDAAGGFMSKLKRAASNIVGDAGSAAGKVKDMAVDAGEGALDAAGKVKDGVGAAAVGTAAAVGGAAAGAGAFLAGDRNHIILVPYNSREALVKWEVDRKDLETIQARGGNQLVLRLYDVTEQQDPPTFQQFDLDESLSEQRIMIPQRNRTYVTALGYLTRSGNFLEMARSESVRIPSA
jgi:ABC-type phosphate transport system substrate-binding protein